tara:strand:- start:1104 stop:1271 length:168 start_codon:yes stop_codon:yes gene_type:complete
MKSTTKKIEIRKIQTSEENASARHITYDIYVNGKYEKTFNDINDALDFKQNQTAN